MKTNEKLTLNKLSTKSTSRKMKISDIVRYIVKNGTVLRAMRKIEQARFTLLLANIELAKSSYADPIHAQRLNEFNQAMVELTKGKWYATQAMDTQNRTDWNSAFHRASAEGWRAINMRGYVQNVDEHYPKTICCRIIKVSASVRRVGLLITFADGNFANIMQCRGVFQRFELLRGKIYPQSKIQGEAPDVIRMLHRIWAFQGNDPSKKGNEVIYD